MRNNEINLLKATKDIDEVLSAKILFSKKLSIGGILLFLVVLILVFFFNIRFSSDLASIDNGIALKEKEIEAKKETESLYLLKGMKLAASRDIINNRISLVPILDFLNNAVSLIQTTIPKGITFTSVAVPSVSEISVSGTAVNPSALEEFISAMTERDSERYFKKVTLTALNRTDAGNYFFNMVMDLGDIKNPENL